MWNEGKARNGKREDAEEGDERGLLCSTSGPAPEEAEPACALSSMSYEPAGDGESAILGRERLEAMEKSEKK